DPDPRVLDRHHDCAPALPGGPDHEAALTSAGLPHGVEAVEHEVQHHLLKLDPVAAHLRQVGGELEAQRHVADDRVAPDEPRHFPDDPVEIEGHEFDVALLDQAPE